MLTLARFIFHSVVGKAIYRGQKIRKRFWPRGDLKLNALLEARSMGGAVSLAELEQVWNISPSKLNVLCIADPLEAGQIEHVLRTKRAASVTTLNSSDLTEIFKRLPAAEIVIVASGVLSSEKVDCLRLKLKSAQRFLSVGSVLKNRSSYMASAIPRLRRRESESSVSSLRALFDEGRRPHVVVLNDMGFQFGAGIAQRRQVSSFLLNGWDVTAVAWDAGSGAGCPVVTGIKGFRNWNGIYSLNHSLRQLLDDLISKGGRSVDRAIKRVQALRPDLVIVGNIHGAEWPVSLLPRLQEMGVPVVAYMHDCYFVTGRCAYPRTCPLFLTGCNETCPTPNEYPPLEPNKIAPAWRARAPVFTGDNAVPLIANSSWTRDIAAQRYGASAKLEVVHLGVDEALFAPVPKDVARRLLGLPNDKTIVLAGVVDFGTPWKGGQVFHDLYQGLHGRPDVELVLFGRKSESTPVNHSFGFIDDERLMALIYNAADIFVSAAVAEAFGQTLVEASACALPVVAFNVGGVPDVVVNDETGILVDGVSSSGLLAAVDRLVADPDLRAELGKNGRARVEERFSLRRQGEVWVEYLNRLC